MLYAFNFMDPDLLRKRVKEKLNENNLNLSQAEKLGGFKAGSLRQFLSGRTNNPTLDTLRATAQLLKISTAELLNESPLTSYFVNNSQWNTSIFRKISSNLADFIDKNQISINSEEAISLIKDFYYSCINKNEHDIDQAFEAWLLSKMTGKSI